MVSRTLSVGVQRYMVPPLPQPISNLWGPNPTNPKSAFDHNLSSEATPRPQPQPSSTIINFLRRFVHQLLSIVTESAQLISRAKKHQREKKRMLL